MRITSFIVLALFAVMVRAQEPCDVSLAITLPSCPGLADGSMTITAGTPDTYDYIWSQDGTLNAPTATGLAAGLYSVVITGASGCITFIDTVMLDPTPPALGNIAITNISCAGNNDGALTFTVDPGPFTWHWTDQPALTATTRTNLPPGIYSVVIVGGPCPSQVSAELGDPGITITGETSYCPSNPPVLTAELEFGFDPDVYLWSTGETTNSVNVQPGFSGNIHLTATDTIIGCTVDEDVLLTELPHPSVAFAPPDSMCIGTEELAILTASTADSLVWRWDEDGFSNAVNPSVMFTNPYWQPISLQGFDLLGCGSAPVVDSVYVRPRLPAIFTAEQVPCTSTIDLKLASTSDSCAFFIGDSLILNTCSGTINWDVHHYYKPFNLTFYSTQRNHCDDTLSTSITLRTVPVLFLPNTFTPNNDGINDTWPGPVDIPENGYEVQLFDRWGANLWTSTNTQEKWDGASLPTGVYVYTMRMEDSCETKKEITTNGFVNLLR